MGRIVISIALLASLLVGCGDGQVKTTKNEEEAFRNPPKEPPAAATQNMQKAMQNAGKEQTK